MTTSRKRWLLTHPQEWAGASARFWNRLVAGDDRIRRETIKGSLDNYQHFLHKQLVAPKLSPTKRRRRNHLVRIFIDWWRGEQNHEETTRALRRYLHQTVAHPEPEYDLQSMARIAMSLGLFSVSLEFQVQAWRQLEKRALSTQSLDIRVRFIRSLLYQGHLHQALSEIEKINTRDLPDPLAGIVATMERYVGWCLAQDRSTGKVETLILTKEDWEDFVQGRDVLIYGPGRVDRLPSLGKGFVVARIMGPGVYRWSSRDDLVGNRTDIVYSIPENIEDARSEESGRVLDALARYSWVCVKKTDALRTSNSRAVNTFSPLYDRGHPQMVPLAVVDLITSGAKPYVIGSDFFASPLAYRPSEVRLVRGLDGNRQSDTGSNGGSFDRTSLMASHNIVENWSLTKNLFEAGLVTGDSGFEEVMSHSLSELMDIYDAHLGISRI